MYVVDTLMNTTLKVLLYAISGYVFRIYGLIFGIYLLSVPELTRKDMILCITLVKISCISTFVKYIPHF